MRQLKLFISYCHADLTPRPGFTESRVGRIMQEVKYELRCGSPSSRFKILRDVEMLVVSDNFRDKIRDAIAACDMAILFLSEDFSCSKECEAELIQLLNAGKTLFLVETEPPLVNDERDRIGKHRATIPDVLYAKFWGLDGNQKPALFGYPLPETSDTRKEYYQALELLVTGIKTRAAKLPNADDEEDSQADDAVFIACPTGDVKAEAMRLATTLEAEGYNVRVFDMALDMDDNPSFSEVLSKVLAKSAVYVQLLGSNPGKEVSGTKSRLARAQYEIGRTARKPLFIWRRADFDIDEVDSDYAAFLKEVSPICQIGNFVEFEDYLKKKLSDIAAKQRSDARRALRARESDVDSSWPFVAIDAAPADRDLAQKLADALVNYVNVAHLDYDVTVQTLAEAITDNNALIFAYGESLEGQKRTQAHFRLIRRPKAEFNFKGLEVAVGNAAPPTALPCPRGPNVHVIKVGEQVDSAAMFGFLKTLGVSVPRDNEAR